MGPLGDTGGTIRTYTVGELRDRAQLIVEAVNESGQPALITEMGRFVALLSPLADVPVESILLERAVGAESLSGAASVLGGESELRLD